jgi:hypothetical protein
MIKTLTGRAAGFGAAAIIAALGFAAAVSAPTSAEARVFVGFGFGFPIGFPFYYPPPYPYPPPAFYPPPPYYPAPVSYPAPASYPAPGTPPQSSGGYAPSGSAGSPPVTYTPRRGWTNAQGEHCREYRTTGPAGNRKTERYGTACRDASGQWRIVN